MGWLTSTIMKYFLITNFKFNFNKTLQVFFFFSLTQNALFPTFHVLLIQEVEYVVIIKRNQNMKLTSVAKRQELMTAKIKNKKINSESKIS